MMGSLHDTGCRCRKVTTPYNRKIPKFLQHRMDGQSGMGVTGSKRLDLVCLTNPIMHRDYPDGDVDRALGV